jgi:hypothetical protein
MNQVLEALEVMSTKAKLGDVTSHRFVVLGAMHSFQAGFPGFSIRLNKHEVAFKGLWVCSLDQRKYFYGGDARFFGRLSNGGRFLPEQVPPLLFVRLYLRTLVKPFILADKMNGQRMC